MKKWPTILFVFATIDASKAQGCFARVSLDRRSVYVQQPFRITITVLTPTWYTAPLDFENIQIPGAFILPFDRTVPGMFDVNGKKYAGLQFYYIVFPYKAGSFSVPSIAIVAQTPPEGSGISRKVQIKTASEHYTVKEVPQHSGTGNWFVAKNVLVHETWSKPLNNLQVGDIVERTITIDAKGTLPQFIPQLTPDSLAFASTYLQDAELKDERDEYDANGRLSQTVIYLLEKEGDFTIPAVELQWWNPNNSKLYTKHALSGQLHVKPNPHLGMLTTLKDSLAAKQSALAPTVTPKKVRTVFGIPWYWAVLILIAGLLLLYRVMVLMVALYRDLYSRYKRYTATEKYAFRQFLQSPLALQSLLPGLYRWWDRFSFPGKTASVSAQLEAEHRNTAAQMMEQYLAAVYRDGNNRENGKTGFKKAMRGYRSAVKKGKQVAEQNKISVEQNAYTTGKV